MLERQLVMWNFDKPISGSDVLECFEVGEGLTRRQVALKLARAKSPTLIVMLNHQVTLGFLRVQFARLPNGVDMWVYYLTESGREEMFELSGENPKYAYQPKYGEDF